MPVAVACPKCNSKYNLPDNLRGRPVKCKACGAAFKIGGTAQSPGVAANVNQNSAKQQALLQARQQQQRQELAQFGLDGPIVRQPELFDQPAAGGMDPLANHVVHDPGFAPMEIAKGQTEEVTASDDRPEFLTNPAIATPGKKKAAAGDPLAGYLEDGEGGGKKGRRRTKGSMGNSGMLLVLVGIVSLGWFGYSLFNVGSVVESIDKSASSDAKAAMMSAYKNDFIVFIVAGVVICGLGPLANRMPFVSTLSSLGLFLLAFGLTAILHVDGLMQSGVVKILALLGLLIAVFESIKQNRGKKRRTKKRSRKT